MLASLGLRWWQYMIISGLHMYYKTVEITGSRKTILLPSIQLCPSRPIIPFKLRRRRSPITSACAMTIGNVLGQTLKRVTILVYPQSPAPTPSAQLYVAFYRSSSFDIVAGRIVERHR